jgi:hypothetical protein
MSLKAVQTFIERSVAYMDSVAYVERYAWFAFSVSSWKRMFVIFRTDFKLAMPLSTFLESD